MDLSKLFKSTEANITMRELLGKDEVKQVLSDFIDDRMAKADGIIIIWAAQNDVFLDAGGFSEAEALGALVLGQSMIIEKGITRR